MRRFLRYLLVTAIGAAIAFAALVWEGSTLEEVVFPIGDVPVVDFATLQRAPAPNQYLLCPKDMCAAEADGAAPVFNMTSDQLKIAWEELLAEAPRVRVLRRDVTNKQIDYVQRTRLMHFPDLITVRFIPVDDTHATMAIYSRSIYGKGDMGVNRARVEGWLAQLKARVG